jgi:Zn-finger nucleic acid-binding protein
MNCPGCNVEMTDLEGDETTLRKCGDCGGLWIDVSDLNRVDLVRITGGDRNHPLSYDTCESCGGTFLESEFQDATDAKVAFQEIVDFFKSFAAKKKFAAG